MEAPPIELTEWHDSGEVWYEIINGAHRLKAAKLFGRTTIKAVIAGVTTDNGYINVL
jgi:ParB-like chromosome segregation protein Spo0J